MARTLSIMDPEKGDVFAKAHLDDDGQVTLEGTDDALEDMRVVSGPKGQLRPKDGEAYFDALKAMYDRATLVAVFEPHEEEEERRKVQRYRDSQKKK